MAISANKQSVLESDIKLFFWETDFHSHLIDHHFQEFSFTCVTKSTGWKCNFCGPVLS